MRKKHLLDKLSKMVKWKKGTAFMAKCLGISELETKQLLQELKQERKFKYVEGLDEYRKGTESIGAVYIEKMNVEAGEREVKFSSNRPLTKEEIEKKFGVDGITSRLSTYWNKETGSGKYLVSANIKVITADTSLAELKKKLLEIFPKSIDPHKQRHFNIHKNNECLVISISDDHCGMVNPENIHGKPEFNVDVYKNRLLKIVEEVKKLGGMEQVHILSLGDQMNGWNQQTTRGGHIVLSKSNQEQFDIYTKARVAFYDALFTSGVSKHYHIHEVDSSNHSGLGFSYMANQFLSLYIKHRFPFVKTSSSGFISTFTYGGHLILFTHGKDERVQRQPFPYALNDRTDAYIMEYLNAHSALTPYSQKQVTFYKGDLHQFGVQMGRFGRYVNVPTISGNSDYGDINFSNTRAGALLEVFDYNSKTVKTQAIWLD